MNLNRVFSERQKKILKKAGANIEDKELEEEEILRFNRFIAFNGKLTMEEQEEIFDTMDDYYNE